jgi:hypothetical protein
MAAGVTREQLAGPAKTFVAQRRVIEIPSAQVVALFATPITIVPAPGAGLFLELVEALWEHRPAAIPVAYAGIAAGEDLVIRYTNASGQIASEVQETTGWLDQTVGATKIVGPRPEVAGTLGVYTVNAALVAHILTGEITTGTGSIWVEVWYRIRPTQIRKEL